VKPETQNWRLEPTGPAKQGATSGLTGTGPGFACQESVDRVFGQVWKQINPFLQSKPGPVANTRDIACTFVKLNTRPYDDEAVAISSQALWPIKATDCPVMG
jgi:hypothetical protein